MKQTGVKNDITLPENKDLRVAAVMLLNKDGDSLGTLRLEQRQQMTLSPYCKKLTFVFDLDW
jgi:hypothetical protein